MHRFPKTPPRLQTVFADAPVYFITCCTYRRRALLATSPVHAALLAFSTRAYAEYNVAVGRYALMPDHLHLFVSGDRAFQLGRWLGLLKQVLGKAVVRAAPTDPLWERGFFDHLLRSHESYDQKWNYVHENPVRAELVATAEDWPYAGEIIRIDRI